MEPIGAKRKLAVILAADFEGYSRLMHADEEATIETLRSHRELIDSMIAAHWGRVFSTAGDSVVADFGSAVEAVRCAISIQEELAKRNADLPDARRMRLRIGVHLGDVMIDGHGLLGDGVNVAARLEGITEPGEICLSGDVYQQVRKKLSLSVQAMGPQRVKNIAEPVAVYRLVPGSGSFSQTRSIQRSTVWARWRTPVLAVLLLVAIGIGGMALWRILIPPAPQAPGDVLSIAVLSFNNLTGDNSQDFLGDGISEAILTELADFSSVSVGARNSSFAYKGKPTKAQQIGKELGVAYVLDGSLQRSGDQVRTTVQLIEVATGKQIWGRRYDTKLGDTLAIQDDVAPQAAAQTLMILGKPQEALLVLRRAIRRRPENRLQLTALLVVAYYYLREYDDTIQASREYLEHRPKRVPVRLILAASLMAAGRQDEAQEEVEKILEQVGGARYLSAKSPLTRGDLAAFKDPDFKDRLYHHLRKAGLPDQAEPVQPASSAK